MSEQWSVFFFIVLRMFFCWEEIPHISCLLLDRCHRDRCDLSRYQFQWQR